MRRFISRDPLREAAGENEYSYVGNNPVSFTDPLGLTQEDPWNPFADDEKEDVVTRGAKAIINIVVDADGAAQDGQTIGNHCLPVSERRWAALRMAYRIAEAAVGGTLAKGGLKILGRGLRRIPWGRLARVGPKACFVATCSPFNRQTRTKETGPSSSQLRTAKAVNGFSQHRTLLAQLRLGDGLRALL